MREPGPDHPITIEPYPGRVRVRFGEHLIADTRAALRLQEASYPPVFYIPRGDVEMDCLERSASTTHCPYKGDANYFTLRRHARTSADAVWTYEAPYPAVAAIKDRLAFYPDRVTIEAD